MLVPWVRNQRAKGLNGLSEVTEKKKKSMGKLELELKKKCPIPCFAFNPLSIT